MCISPAEQARGRKYAREVDRRLGKKSAKTCAENHGNRLAAWIRTTERQVTLVSEVEGTIQICRSVSLSLSQQACFQVLVSFLSWQSNISTECFSSKLHSRRIMFDPNTIDVETCTSKLCLLHWLRDLSATVEALRALPPTHCRRRSSPEQRALARKAQMWRSSTRVQCRL